jgi:TPR repeat protein
MKLETAMKKTTNYIIYPILALLISISSVQAQSKNDQARNYLYAAELAYEEQNYADALDALNQVENIMGKSGAKLAALRVKIYADQQQWTKAKKALNTFYSFNPSEKFSRKMSPYLLKIDEGTAEALAATLKLGIQYYNGDGVVRNQAHAAKLFKETCDSGSTSGCWWLGDSYYSGHGVEKSYIRANELYGKVCEAGHGGGCFGLTVLYRQGWGVEQSNEREVEFLQKACDFDHSVGCYNLGIRYKVGKVVTKNFTRANLLFKKACNLGYTRACSFRAE